MSNLFRYFYCLILHDTEARRDMKTPYGTVKRRYCTTCGQERTIVAI